MIYTSTPMLVELGDILARRKFERKIAASRMTPEQIIEGYAQLATLVHQRHRAGC